MGQPSRAKLGEQHAGPVGPAPGARWVVDVVHDPFGRGAPGPVAVPAEARAP
jgi:hypothetical protein